MTEVYDEDYFERGVESGKSLYSNYQWLPELTIPLAHRIIRRLSLIPQNKVLDFGCAKGFLVKALRLLDIDAYGVDISDYALQECDKDVSEYLLTHSWWESLAAFKDWDLVIAKDVLEHLTEQELDQTLYRFSLITRKLFVVVPLGNGERFTIEAYEHDKTHQLRKPLDWWSGKLTEHFNDVSACYGIVGIKDNWFKVHPQGNGFLVAKTS